jgi:hypothetical protein
LGVCLLGVVTEGSLEWILRLEGQHTCHAGGASGTDVWQAWDLERHEREVLLPPTAIAKGATSA